MSTQTPAGSVSPLHMAKKNAHWRGEIALPSFDRLGSYLSADAPVVVELRFATTDEGTCSVTGSARIDARFECQSCLEHVGGTIEAEIDFQVVASEQEARATASAAEPFLLEGESVAVADLIEDDLILSLPTRGCDPLAPCPNRPEYSYPDPTADDVTTATAPEADETNPFAVLADLKRGKD